MHPLLSRDPPWVLQSSADVRTITEELQRVAKQNGGRLYVFDARRCATWEDFYRHCWDVLHPPQYFGENSAALYDVVTDGHEIGEGPVSVLFEHANHLLIREGADEPDFLLGVWARIGRFWADPDGEPLQAPRAFKTVLHLTGSVPAQLHEHPVLSVKPDP